MVITMDTDQMLFTIVMRDGQKVTGWGIPPRLASPTPVYRRGAAMKNRCHAPDIDSKKNKAN